MEKENQRVCYGCFGSYPGDGACPHCGYDPEEAGRKYPAALAGGTILAGEYIVGRVLGQGGFGITYLAMNYRTGGKVAVKEFFPESLVMRQPNSAQVTAYADGRLENFQYGLKRFLDEAKLLAQLAGNPGIVNVRSYFEEYGTAYFVMDYIEGTNFKAYIAERGGRVTWQEARDILCPVMEALESAHQKGIIHRDVTPDNIIIANDHTIKLLDFGAARYSTGEQSRSLDVVLKAGYAPKEQYTRRGRQGPYTDVYSLAACFYASLSGFLPPESLDRMEEDDLVPLSTRGVALPAQAEEAILKGLEVRAEDRFQSMAAFQAAIGAEPYAYGGGTQQDTFGQYGGGMQQNTSGQYGGTQQNNSAQSESVVQHNPFEPKERELTPEEEAAADLLREKKRKQKKRIAIGSAAAAAVLLITAVIAMNATWTKTIYYPNGAVYEGDVRRGERHGTGTMTWENGNVYEGEWQEGKMNGKGKLLFVNGDVYEGSFSSNKMSGNGEITFADGASLSCRIGYGGKPSGKGTYHAVNGKDWDGEFEMVSDLLLGQGERYVFLFSGLYESGNRVGRGTITLGFPSPNEMSAFSEKLGIDFSDGMEPAAYTVEIADAGLSREDLVWDAMSVYTGEIVDGRPCGQGSYTWDDGKTLSGMWEYWEEDYQNVDDIAVHYEGTGMDGKKVGFGEMTWENGASYLGEWRNDNREGHGRESYVSGNVYEGEFFEGNRGGEGIMTYSDGSAYVGEWKDGLFDGSGVYLYADGRIYEGGWKEDKRDGQGKMVYADGGIYVGGWKENLFDGVGTYIWANGASYEGEWKEDNPEGEGTYTWSDGESLSGIWEYMERDSMNTDGQALHYSGMSMDGKRAGYGKMSWDDGDVYDGEWKSGSMEGEGTYTWEDGSCYTGAWKKDQRHGTGIFSRSDGTRYEQVWENGERVSQKELSD